MASSTGKRNREYYYNELHENQSKNINSRKHIISDQTRFNNSVLEVGNRNQINPQEETPRLGLALKMSTSETNRLELAMSQAFRQHNSFKACNIPALSLKIGNWEWQSKREGDLVAKFYYRTKKLVWEVLCSHLKKKMEIQWSHISAMNVYNTRNNISRLEIQLKEHPKLCEELQLNPKMRTKWENTGNDFTGGQTRICSQHTIIFAGRVLDGPFRKLLECDKRLFNLTQQPFPYQNPPLFQHQILHGRSPVIPNNIHQRTIVPYAQNLDQPVGSFVGHSSFNLQSPVLKSPSAVQSINNPIPKVPLAVIQDEHFLPNHEIDLGILDDLQLPELLEMDITNDAEVTHQDKNFKNVFKEHDSSIPLGARIGMDNSSNEVKDTLAYVDDDVFSVCDPFAFQETNPWSYPEFNMHELITNGGYNDVNQIGFAADELFVFQNSNM